MSLNYSLGFLVASLVQAAIVMLTETLGISQLGAKLTITQLLMHILAGQIAGYSLLYILKSSAGLREVSTVVTGAVWGTIVWAVVLSINSMQGKVEAPWTQGLATVLASLLAFMVFGWLATYTIKKYDYTRI